MTKSYLNIVSQALTPFARLWFDKLTTSGHETPLILSPSKGLPVLVE